MKSFSRPLQISWNHGMPPAICVCNYSSYNGWSILPCCADAFDGLYKIKAPVLNCLSSLSGTPYHFINFLQQLAKINFYVWKYSLCLIWGIADPSHFLAAILSQNYLELYNNGKKRHWNWEYLPYGTLILIGWDSKSSTESHTSAYWLRDSATYKA